MAFERTKHFLDTFGEPRPPRPPLIPKRYRALFYFAVSVVSLVVLIALVWFVLIPGIRSQQAAGPANVPQTEEVKP